MCLKWDRPLAVDYKNSWWWRSFPDITITSNKNKRTFIIQAKLLHVKIRRWNINRQVQIEMHHIHTYTGFVFIWQYTLHLCLYAFETSMGIILLLYMWRELCKKYFLWSIIQVGRPWKSCRIFSWVIRQWSWVWFSTISNILIFIAMDHRNLILKTAFISVYGH